MLSLIGASIVIYQKIVCLFLRIQSAEHSSIQRRDILSFDKSGKHVDLFIETDLMIPHSAQLRYSSVGCNTISFKSEPCSICQGNMRLVNEENFLQLSLHFFRSPEWKNYSIWSESNETGGDSGMSLGSDLCDLTNHSLYDVASLHLSEMLEDQEDEIPFGIRDWIENRFLYRWPRRIKRVF